MDSELNIDLNELLKPIPGDSPSGKYLRYTEIYDQIMYSIFEENPNLIQGVWQRPLKMADWKNTKILCVKALTEKTKDIQICNWLLDSFVHLNGFTGLSFGLKVILEITKKFWETIHPLPLENDPETRYAPYYWLEEKFFIQLRLLPFTKSITLVDSFTLDRWEKGSKPSEEDFEAIFKELKKQIFITGEEFFVDIRYKISEALRTIKELKEFLLQKNSSAPHFIQLISVIESIKSIIDIALNEIGKTKKVITSIEMPNNGEKESEGNYAHQNGSELSDETLNMDNVYLILNQIAEYLMENDSQNITGYIVKNALQLRSVLIKDIIKTNAPDSGTYSKVIELLGIE